MAKHKCIARVGGSPDADNVPAGLSPPLAAHFQISSPAGLFFLDPVPRGDFAEAVHDDRHTGVLVNG